jgi:hypothetical protein
MPTTEQNFVDQQLRPICENMRALEILIDTMSISWFAGINTSIPNDGTSYDDGRPAEGLTPMVGSDIHNAVSNLLAVIAGTDPYNDQIISKPTVRAISVS